MSTIQINVYGKLRKKYPLTREVGTRGIIEVPIEEGETLESVFNRVGIRPEELYTIFLNSKLLTTKNSMAEHLGYQQYCEDCHNWDLCVKLKEGDKVAIFGFDMANLVI
ncbi:MAG: hypothetical protein GXO55_10900 [Chloroflexi bacterium]|nr:hypothetical protein [Chloroflexota bacterium]